MDCSNRYAILPCSLSGLGVLHKTYEPDQGYIDLAPGNGGNFPELADGQYFNVLIGAGNCGGCCAELKVYRKDKDRLYVHQFEDIPCPLAFGQRVEYTCTTVRAIKLIAQDAAPQFALPLVYNCATHTVSVDCDGIKRITARPCSEIYEDRSIQGDSPKDMGGEVKPG